jgi:hypothetical protein
VYAEPRKKPTPCPNPKSQVKTEGNRLNCGAGAAPRGPRLGRRAQREGCDRLLTSKSRARETGRAAPLRRDRREGLQAAGQTGKARARTAGYVVGADGRDTARAELGRAGRTGAGVSASANAGLHWGVNAGHTMRGACGTRNAGRMQTCEQTGGRERHRSCGQRHHAPHGHGQGHGHR